MYTAETKIRVRYSETDKMGYVYYGNYAAYFEVARTEMIRKIGLTYRSMEEQGIMLPVLSFSIKYFRPAFYDDLLTIKTILKQLPSSRIEFEYEVYNEAGKLLNKAETTLAFVDAKTMKPVAAPEILIEKTKQYFSPNDDEQLIA